MKNTNRTIAGGLLALLLALSQPAGATIVTSPGFSVGLGYTADTGVSNPWTNDETSAANTPNPPPSLDSNFDVTVSLVSDRFSSQGPTFDDRDLADGGSGESSGSQVNSLLTITATTITRTFVINATGPAGTYSLLDGFEAYGNIEFFYVIPEPSTLMLFGFRYRQFGRGLPMRSHGFLRRSDDDGRTFGEEENLWRDQPLHLSASSVVTRLSTGRLLAPVDRLEGETWSPSEHYRSGCLYSDDDGTTWQTGDFIDLPMRGTMEAHVAECRDGRVWMVVRTQLGALFGATRTTAE